MKYTLNVNDLSLEVEADPDTPLLNVLRNDLRLNGPRFGCGLGQCGTCTVLLDGRPVKSCVTPVPAVGEKPITTLAGLRRDGALHPVQQAFIEEQAMQCGYCSNGMIMAATALLQRNPQPTVTEIRTALDSYLCRCGTHHRIIRAVSRAAGLMQEAGK